MSETDLARRLLPFESRVSSRARLASLRARIHAMIPRHGFARQVGTLVSGTVAGQFVMVLAAPLLTRLYDPDEFGLYAIYGALLLVLSVAASLRYQVAIPIAENEPDAMALSRLSLLALLATVVLITFAVFVGGERIAALLNAPDLAPWLKLLPLSLLVYGLFQIHVSRALRAQRFPTISAARVTQAIGLTVCQILGATFGMGGLLLGQLTGQTSAFLLLLRKGWRKVPAGGENGQPTAHDLLAPQRASLRTTAFRYRRFPIYSTWGGLFNAIGQQAPPLLLAAWYTPAAAGFYALAQRLLSMPMALVGSSIADVFFSGVAQSVRDGTIGSRVRRVHRFLAELAMPPLLVLVLIGPDLFAIVFGEEWREAGLYSVWLSPMLYMVLITSPLGSLLSALHREHENTVFQTVLLGSRLAALWAGTARGDAVFAIACFSLASVITWIGLLLRLFYLSGNHVHELALDTLRTALKSVVICAPLILAIAFDASKTIQLVALACVIALIGAHCIRLALSLRTQ